MQLIISENDTHEFIEKVLLQADIAKSAGVKLPSKVESFVASIERFNEFIDNTNLNTTNLVLSEDDLIAKEILNGLIYQ